MLSLNEMKRECVYLTLECFLISEGSIPEITERNPVKAHEV